MDCRHLGRSGPRGSPPAGTMLAAGLHTFALVVLAVPPLVALRLVVFGGTAVLLHAASAGLLARPT